MPVPEIKQIDMAFPMKGLHEASAVSEQPEGTSPYARNVRGHDWLAKRDRGCQRSGLIKFTPDAQTADPIDKISVAALGLATSSNLPVYDHNFTGDSTADSGALSGSYAAAVAAASGRLPVLDYNYVIDIGLTGQDNYFILNTFNSQTTTLTIGFAVEADPTGALVSFQMGGVYNVLTGFRSVNIEGADTVNVQATGGYSLSQTIDVPFSFAGGANERVVVIVFSDTQITVAIEGATTLVFPLPWGGVDMSGENGVLALNFTMGASLPYQIFEMQINTVSATGFDLTAEKIIYEQSGQAYYGDVDGFVEVDSSAITDSVAYTVGNEVSICPAFGYFYLTDGQLPLRRIKADDGTITEPAATGGDLPTLPRLLALYRGRLFNGRFLGDPNNYIASASGDPLNYDVSSLSQIGAFSGNDTQQAGLLGDILTAMIPYGDVSMVMGMANQIAVMRGDPKAGGSIDTVSREIGIVSPTAWARDPEGILYFMARDGLYRMTPQSQPQPMSQGRLDDTLGGINFSTTRVFMEWDAGELGLKIYLYGGAASPMTIVFWFQRKDQFWVDTYPAGIAASATSQIRARGSKLGAALLGCADGYLRVASPSALTDDGEAISSFVQYTPQQFMGPMVDAKIMQTRNLWGDSNPGNFSVQYSLLTGTDAISAQTATQSSYGKIITAAGYQAIDRSRTRGACAIFQIENAELGKSWSIEKTTMLVAQSGRVRV